jgi:hypothetical protein
LERFKKSEFRGVVISNYVFAKTDGLLHYGPLSDFRHPTSYVDRILRGAKPDDLPVQFPTKYEIAVNLKTAKALPAIDPAARRRGDRVTNRLDGGFGSWLCKNDLSEVILAVWFLRDFAEGSE